MASFPIKRSPKEAQLCRVCRDKKKSGKSLPGYDNNLDFVCDSCYKKFFKDVTVIERKGPSIELRPAQIVSDEYRIHNVFTSQIIRDIIIWVAIGVAIWGILTLIGILFPGSGDMSDVGAIPVALYMLLSIIGALGTFVTLIRGLLRAMDVQRRIILAIKGIVYIGCALVYLDVIIKFINKFVG